VLGYACNSNIGILAKHGACNFNQALAAPKQHPCKTQVRCWRLKDPRCRVRIKISIFVFMNCINLFLMRRWADLVARYFEGVVGFSLWRVRFPSFPQTAC